MNSGEKGRRGEEITSHSEVTGRHVSIELWGGGGGKPPISKLNNNASAGTAWTMKDGGLAANS